MLNSFYLHFLIQRHQDHSVSFRYHTRLDFDTHTVSVEHAVPVLNFVEVIVNAQPSWLVDRQGKCLEVQEAVSQTERLLVLIRILAIVPRLQRLWLVVTSFKVDALQP